MLPRLLESHKAMLRRVSLASSCHVREQLPWPFSPNKDRVPYHVPPEKLMTPPQEDGEETNGGGARQEMDRR